MFGLIVWSIKSQKNAAETHFKEKLIINEPENENFSFISYLFPHIMKENNKHSVYAETEMGSSQFFGIFTSKKKCENNESMIEIVVY